MSSEAMPKSHNPDHESENVVSVSSLTRNSAEIIDFSKASTEVVTGMFVSELRHPSRNNLRGSQLAAYIQNELSGADTDPTSLRSRLSAVVAGVDIMDLSDELFDHKFTHDQVFKELVRKLQSTKTKRGADDEREATKRLTELRASLETDSTDDDATWYDVIERLFT